MDSDDLKNPVVVKNVEFKRVNLCTNWDYAKTRGTAKMLAECRPPSADESDLDLLSSLPSPYDVIHPFKLTKFGYKDWDRAFDWATAGTSRIDLDAYTHK